MIASEQAFIKRKKKKKKKKKPTNWFKRVTRANAAADTVEQRPALRRSQRNKNKSQKKR